MIQRGSQKQILHQKMLHLSPPKRGRASSKTHGTLPNPCMRTRKPQTKPCAAMRSQKTFVFGSTWEHLGMQKASWGRKVAKCKKRYPCRRFNFWSKIVSTTLSPLSSQHPHVQPGQPQNHICANGTTAGGQPGTTQNLANSLLSHI